MSNCRIRQILEANRNYTFGQIGESSSVGNCGNDHLGIVVWMETWEFVELAVRVEVGHKPQVIFCIHQSTSPPKHSRLTNDPASSIHCLKTAWAASNIASASICKNSSSSKSWNFLLPKVVVFASCVPQLKVSFELRSWRGLRMIWTSPQRMPFRWNPISQHFLLSMLWWDQCRIILVAKFLIFNIKHITSSPHIS